MKYSAETIRVAVGGTKNGDFFYDPVKYELAELESAGFDFSHARKHFKVSRENWNRGSYRKLQNPRFNGGMKNRLISRLQKGDKLYRFGRQRLTRNDVVAGSWWFDENACIYLWKISRNDDEKFRINVRHSFCIPEEWSDLSRMVTCRIAKDYWCFKGVSARVVGHQSQQIMNGGNMDTLQIYIPGGLSVDDCESVQDASLIRSVY